MSSSLVGGFTRIRPESVLELIAPWLASANILEAHEGDELEKLVGRIAEPNLAALASRCELEPRESVNCHGIGTDASHVTEDDTPLAAAEQRANSRAQPRKVGARNRAADGERDYVRP